MKIRLSNGELLEVSSSRTTPSKRSVKLKSGSLKRWNSSKVNASVGGRASVVSATYAPADTLLCIVRPTSSGKPFTWDLGGSASTGYIGGRGI